MPTLGEWTHSVPVEVDFVGDAPHVLTWFHDNRYSNAPNCYSGSGCAERGPSANGIVVKESAYGVPFPDDILYDIGLHEALHVLFDADHSAEGPMCIKLDCYSPLYTGGVHWDRASRLTPLHEEVYKVYGNPLLRHGMALARVGWIVRVRE